ncbi:MAG: helix-turn-helix transcriptional regulator [Pseudomonadota bacterium]
MSTKIKDAEKILQKIRGRPLTFGQLIHSVRLCDEITQIELADKLKISRAHLCDIEKGRRLVSAQRAAQFAKVLGYSIESFVAQALEDQLRQMGLALKITIEAA